jgi:toxin ParE1/3/4
MPVIVKLPRAKSDLVEIWGYIADDNEDRADAFVDRIDQKLLTFASNPTMGRARQKASKFSCWAVRHLLPPDPQGH